jgi:hypothetical protein
MVAVPATGEFMDKFCGKEEESTAVIELVKTWVVPSEKVVRN